MTFDEQLHQDLSSVFFNCSEFAKEHDINDKTVPIIIDNDELLKLVLQKSDHSDGIFAGKIMFSVQEDVLGFEPFVGQCIALDGNSLYVTDAKHDNGVFTIIIEANRS